VVGRSTIGAASATAVGGGGGIMALTGGQPCNAKLLYKRELRLCGSGALGVGADWEEESYHA
jgi:hypothetical protein